MNIAFTRRLCSIFGAAMNCWEYMKCGREKGGTRASELGVCPAYPDGGNRCAFVAGTLCGDRVTGSFAEKISNCMECPYFYSAHYDAQVQLPDGKSSS